MPPDNPVAEPERFVHEEIIEPDQIGDYKAMMHCVFVACWLVQPRVAPLATESASRSATGGDF